MLKDFFEYIDNDEWNRPLHSYRHNYLMHLKEQYDQTGDEKYRQQRDNIASYSWGDLYQELKANGFRLIGCSCSKERNIVERRM